VPKSGLAVGGGLLAVVVIGLVVGLVGLNHFRRTAPGKPPAPAPKVIDSPEITLTGRLQARTIERVHSHIAGILDAWYVDVGQEVYQDQLVGRIRNADLDNAVQTAQAALDRAEVQIAQLEAQVAAARLEASRTTAEQSRARNELDRIEKIYVRYKNLMDSGAIARLTFEKTETEYHAAEKDAANRDAAVKEAADKLAALERDLEEARRAVADQTAAIAKAKDAAADGDLRSPADGVVLERMVHQGDRVEDLADLMTVATDLTKLAVSVTPEPAVLARIHTGQHAFVRISNVELPGEVHEMHGAEVIVEFTSPEPITKLGGAAQVRMVF
jgi:multidrug resistance efflux pump